MQQNPIACLHGEGDKRQNDLRIRKVLALLGVGMAVAAAGIVASLIWRDPTHMHNANEQASQYIAIGITLLWGAITIFLWSMKLTPLLCYRRYLKEIGRGLSREVEGRVVRFEKDATFREGLTFYAMLVNIGQTDDQEDERLLYWDARLDRPGVEPGDRVCIRAHGNDIIGLLTR